MVFRDNRTSILVKVISTFSILMISTSILGIAYAQSDVLPFVSSQKYLVPTSDMVSSSPSSHMSKTVRISFTENMGVSINSESQQKQDVVLPKISTIYNIQLSENLRIYTNNYNPNFVSIVQQNFEKTTMDKISNSDRIRISGKKIVIENSIPTEKLSDRNPILLNTIPLVQKNINENNVMYVLDKIWSDNTNLVSLVQFGSEDFYLQLNSVENNVIYTLHGLADPNNPTLLVLLIPLSGFLLIDIKEVKLRYNLKRIFSFCFIVILVASSAVTPMSISSNYWGVAYAQPSNSTVDLSHINGTNSQIITPISTLSNSTLSNSTLSNSTLTNSTLVSNSTLTNSTLVSNSTLTNSTLVSNSTLTNSTLVSNSTLSNSTLVSLMDGMELDSHLSANSILPVKLWKLDTSLNDTKSTGKLRIQNDTNGKLLQLKGNGFLTSDATSTANLNALTLSAWVKPDYSQGSGTFTVISKENQFALAVNNNIPPAKKATFSVYDGIKWSTVNSTSTLGEDWTHLVATYNGSSISLYVNGTLQSSLHLAGIPTLAVNGKLVTTDVSHISSNSDMIVGAYFNSLSRNPRNLFSGSIQGVNLYNSTFTPAQVSGLYLKDELSYAPVNLTPIPVNATGLNMTSLNNTSILSQISNSTLLNSTSVSNSTGINDTGSLPVVPVIQNLKSSYMMSESPEFNLQIFKDSDMKKMKNIPMQAVQQNGWADKNTTLSVKVIAPDGKEIPIKSQFKKMKEGKFDIKLISGRYGKPGIYTIKTTLVTDGKTYTTQDQYAWGLVSLNTEKSIYQPGQTANMTIVVLDNMGHPVCNADILLNVNDPNSQITLLSSANGAITSSECGLYNAHYATSIPGNYTVNVAATANSIKTDFTTSFMVENNFAFDIVRTAQSKIDPVNNPNIFNVAINVKSFVGSGPVTIREYVPNVLNITTDGTVSQNGDTKIITWKQNLDATNSTNVTYTYSVPLIYPQLYALGKVIVDQSNQSTFSEARNWYVAVDPVHVDTAGTTAAVHTVGQYLNFSYTVPTGHTNQVLVVGLGVEQATQGLETVTQVLWGDGVSGTNCNSNAQSFTDSGADEQDASSVKTLSMIWHLTAPNTGTKNICIIGSSALIKGIMAGAITISGIDQTNPVHATSTATAVPAKSTTFNNVATSNNGDLVVDNIFTGNNAAAVFTSSQTTSWSLIANTGGGGNLKMGIGGSALNATSTSTTFTWKSSVTTAYSWSAVAFKRAPILKSLSDSISLTDSISEMKSVAKSLSDNLSVTDSISAARQSATKSQSLSDNLGMTDSSTQTRPSVTQSQSLSDSMVLSDSISASRIAITHTQPLSDSMVLSDSSSAARQVKSASQSLSDNLSVTDSSSVTRPVTTQSQSLSDNMITSDSISAARQSATKSQSLSDNLGMTDSNTQTRPSVTQTKSLSDTMTLSDSISSGRVGIPHTQSLSDSMVLSDSSSQTRQVKSASQSLSDNLSVTDSVSFSGSIVIKTIAGNSLISGASYLVVPNPSTGLGSITVSDTTNSGIIKITSALYGTYNVTQTTTPSSYDVLVPSNRVTVSASTNNATNTFTLVSTSTDLSQLPPTKSESPDLNSTTFNTWKNSYDAKIVNGSQTSTVSTVHELPSLITAGSQNITAINSAISSQSSVSLSATLSQSASGTTVMNTLKVPNYTMPTSSNLVAVLPAFVASGSASSNQFVTTPSIPKVTPGQQIILPVQSNSISSTGGLKQMNITASSSVSSTGNAKSEWFVVESNNVVPSSITQLSSSGITGTVSLFVQVKYPYEETGTGINWNDKNNFATSATLDTYVNKPTSDTIQKDANGCPVIDVYTLVGSTWTSSGITIVSVKSISTTQCDVKFKTPHFSNFSVVSRSASTSTSTSVGQSTGSSLGGGGSIGASSSSGQSGPSESTIGQGGILSDLKILDVSYDTCNTNTVKILVAYSDNNPSIILRTSIAGVVQATSAKEQPFAVENENATIKKLVYEAPINSKETTFEVLALQAMGHDIYSVGKTITITSCQGEVSFEKEQAVVPVEVDTSAPRIFDVKFQLDNGVKIPSSEDNHVVDSQSVTVYAIVDTKTALDNAELRFVKAGDSVTSYDVVKMNTIPIQISNSTYLISGTISKDMIKSPALTYWISIHNSAGKTVNSNSYSIGVTPSYPVIGNLELDAKMARIESTTAHPTAYYTNNSTGPVYGRVVLLVNNAIAYASPSQVFTTGQNVVNLEWKTPTVGNVYQYPIQARAEIYGKSIDALPSYITTFPGTVSMPISKLENVVDISVGNNTVAKASTLYSSFTNDGTMRFKVTTSDGTCIIGADNDCLVTKSTLGLAGNFKSITVGDQIYRIRYSGPNDALERFSITSIDSMSGNWKVEIESTNGLLPSAHAMDDVYLKVKYRAVELPFVSENQ
ncbi:MAG TPA: LamG-like jellyroll fold domain-containing protein [Candidatus Nitrosotalea sp.]|nr:LamG-like jellyroll fold domain-containing protein [Candidatus Nitrosotalea sp.]